MWTLGLRRNTSATSDVPHMDSQHLTVADLELFHRLGIVVEQLAIVVDVLGGWGYVAFGLDGGTEGFDDGVGGYVEAEEVVVLRSLLVVDGECDTPVLISNLGQLCYPGLSYMMSSRRRTSVCVCSQEVFV